MTSKPRFLSSDRKWLWLLLLPIIILTILIMVFPQVPNGRDLRGDLNPDSQDEEISQPLASSENSSGKTKGLNSSRPVFTHSKLNGGVRSVEELKNGIQKDSFTADTPQTGSLQLVPSLNLASGESSSDYASSTLGGQAGGGSGFNGGGSSAGFVGGFIPGSGATWGGRSKSSGSSPASGHGGSISPGGKSALPNGGSGNSSSPGSVVGGGDFGNQGDGQGTPRGSNSVSISSIPSITGNEKGLPNSSFSGLGAPGTSSTQRGNKSSTTGHSTPPTGNGGNTYGGGGSTGPTSHNWTNSGNNPGNFGDTQTAGNSDILPPPGDFTQRFGDGNTNGTDPITLTTPGSTPPVQVPEPSTLVLILSGLTGYLALKKLSKKNL